MDSKKKLLRKFQASNLIGENLPTVIVDENQVFSKETQVKSTEIINYVFLSLF